MSQITICDICKEIITPTSKKYILGINPVTESGKLQTNAVDFEETAQGIISNNYRLGRCQVFEICGECKKVLEHLFKLRTNELKDIKCKLEKQYKETKDDE